MQRWKKTLTAIIFAATMQIGAVPKALADSVDFCIKCTNPDQTYVCRIQSQGAAAQGQQFVCIMNIAKDYNHDSCGATSQSASCSGPVIQYELAGSPSQQMPVNTNKSEYSPGVKETNDVAEKPIPKKNKEPKTLVEFTKQTTKATQKSLESAGESTNKALKKTGDTLKNTGKNIGSFTSNVGNKLKDAASVTLNCLTTLFTDCSK